MPRGLIITILFLLIGTLAYNWMGPFNWGEGGEVEGGWLLIHNHNVLSRRSWGRNGLRDEP